MKSYKRAPSKHHHSSEEEEEDEEYTPDSDLYNDEDRKPTVRT
jgi:hypothetical protein